MYYPEFSAYDALGEYSILGTVRIGWLDKKYDFTTGDTSYDFKNRLFSLCHNSVRTTRGFHQCQFCDLPPYEPIVEEWHGEKIWLGSAEIRVFCQDKTYASPNLVFHYVVEHDYCPPEEFIEAVLQGPLPKTTEYEKLINRLP